MKFALTSSIALISIGVTAQENNNENNVLFISCDDLKPLLSCYGDPVAKTPNFDRLARMATTFDNAYVSQAVCAPSRFSTFTGLRSDQLKVWDIKTKFRPLNPGIQTLPDFLMKKGFVAAATGKLFHHEDQQKWNGGFFDASKLLKAKNVSGYHSKKALAMMEAGKKLDSWKARNILKNKKLLFSTEFEDLPDSAYYDGVIAKKAVELMTEYSTKNKQFFLAVGFKKPHLPFVAPKKYWDMYSDDDIHLAAFRKHSKNSPKYAYHNWGELKAYSDIDNKATVLSDEKQKELIHGYYACVSFLDAQLGKVLDAYEKLNLDKNTLLVLWGDHGWHLGDHGLWCKHSNFEQATKAPLFIVQPGIKGGKRYKGMVEYVDIAPTVLDYLDYPKLPNNNGNSLLPVIKDITKENKEFAVSQFPRRWGKDIMGYTLRNKRYRYTAWYKWDKNSGKVDRVPESEELYDYKKDYQETESKVKSPEYKTILEDLRNKMTNFLEKNNRFK